ncbi:MAG: aminotransferase class I/II-fold pyridoxal phosphate-dependent enzyme, partial [Lachnospiraceae bacterium]|nr:aminotransferase class I/II-fold pyridoxal phosphate-dependent enzyme [Lachnospiraceae bacterium]
IKHRRKPEVLIVAPAYAEYARNVAIAGGNCSYFFLRKEDDFRFDVASLIASLSGELSLLMICNPVNPTGTALKAKELEEVLKRCEELDIICAVDETYVDFADVSYDASPLSARYPGLFIIRSMSKFFSAPGLRIGYGITSDERLLREIEENKDPWSVSSLSNAAAILMLKDKEYINSAKNYMALERERVCKKLDELKQLGITYIDPTANFVLVHIPEEKLSAEDLFERALQEKMMIRNCSDYNGLGNNYIRFCFMKETDDDRLLAFIKESYS